MEEAEGNIISEHQNLIHNFDFTLLMTSITMLWKS